MVFSVDPTCAFPILLLIVKNEERHHILLILCRVSFSQRQVNQPGC